jgi:hypothetical protein
MQHSLRISKSYIQTVIKQGLGTIYADIYLTMDLVRALYYSQALLLDTRHYML